MRALTPAALGGALLASLTLLAGCSPSKEPRAGLELRMAPTLAADVTCGTTTTLVSSSAANQVRVTVMRQTDTGPQFVCDKVIPISAEVDIHANQPSLYAPVKAGEKVAIIAEAWIAGLDGGIQEDAPVKHDGPKDVAPEATSPPDAADDDGGAAADAGGLDAPHDVGPKQDAAKQDASVPAVTNAKLIASGRLPSVDLQSTATQTVYLDDARSFSCTAAPASLPRAFHSATLLPDGRVALVGGLVADTAGGTTVNPQQLFATSVVELYDPSSQTFTTLTDSRPDMRVPRAFHQAFVLDSSTAGTVSLLIVGGVMPKDSSDTTAVVDMHEQIVQNLNPTANAKAAATEILAIDLVAGTYTHAAQASPEKAARFLQAATWIAAAPDGSRPGYFVVAGGAATGMGTQSLPVPISTIELFDDAGDESAVVPVNLMVGRIGATLTQMEQFKPKWLLLGGNLYANGSLGNTPAETVAEQITANTTGDPKTVQTATIPLAGRVPTLDPVAYHTATPVIETDSGAVATVIMGGFQIQSIPGVTPSGQLSALYPQPPDATTSPLRLFKSGPVVEDLAVPAGIKAVGHHEAVQLADGTVLFLGGVPYNDGLANNATNCLDPANPQCHNQCPWNTECPSRPCTTGHQQQRVDPTGQAAQGVCAVCQAFRYWHSATAADRRVETQGDLKVPRFGHRATLLADGTVLVTGGITSHLNNGCSGTTTVLATVASAEIYNPQGTVVADDPLAALGVARDPGMAQSDPCCVCPSTIAETNRLAKQCTGTRACVWSL